MKLNEIASQRAYDQAAGRPASWTAQRPLAALEHRLRAFSSRDGTEALTETIQTTKQFNRDQPSWSDRGDLSNVFVIEKGFAFKFEILPGGQRHIADFYGPGAICNWSRLNDFEQQDDIVFKARTMVTLLDARKLATLFERNASLASLIKRHELARAMRTTQRVRSLISRNAADKLLVTLLDLMDEFAVAGMENEWIDLPFTQQELADLLGVTPVHVSRVLSKLEEDGIIERDRRLILLRDQARIKHELAYRHFFSSGRG